MVGQTMRMGNRNGMKEMNEFKWRLWRRLLWLCEKGMYLGSRMEGYDGAEGRGDGFVVIAVYWW